MKKQKFLRFIIICIFLLSLSSISNAAVWEKITDITPPDCAFTIENATYSNGIYYTDDSTLNLNITASDNRTNETNLKMYISNGPATINVNTVWQNFSKTASIPVTENKNDIHIYVKDEAGNISPSVNSIFTEYTITYSASGATNVPPAEKAIYGKPYNVTMQEPKMANKYFLGWSETSGATTATWKSDDVMFAYEITGNKTLYAVWSDTPRMLSERVKVGDFVEFPVEYTNVTVNSTKANITGWRVIDVTDGVVKLISAGTPLTYTNTNNATTLNNLKTNFVNTTFASNGFSESLETISSNMYATEFGIATETDLQKLISITAGQDVSNYAGTLNNTTDYLIAGNSTLYSVSGKDGKISVATNGTYGIRPVVTVVDKTYVVERNTNGSWKLDREKKGYAVYSETDNSLRFYYTKEIIRPGKTYNGKISTNVYENVEVNEYSSSALVPWHSQRSSITKVVVEDAIAPISTAYWFNELINTTTMDLSKLNTSSTKNMTNMFTNMRNLTEVKLGSTFSFNGNGTTRLTNLPTPSNTYIAGANGKWYNIANDVGYTPTSVPNKTAATYSAIGRYTVTLNPNGGSVTPTTLTVTYNETYGSLPTPTRVGYTFKGWYTAETGGTVVTSGTNVTTASAHTIYAQWTANTNTAYKVQHWQQKIDAATTQNSTNYTLKDTDNLTGTTGASVTPTVKTTYTGFTVPSTQTVTIAADGSTVVNYYYTRNSYTLTLNKNSYVSSVSGGGTYHYGKSVSISAVLGSATGYTYSWTNWTSNNTSLLPNQSAQNTSITIPAGNVTLTANGSRTANTNTPYKVQHWLQKIDGGAEQNNINYTIVSADTQNLTGTTGASVTPTVKTTYTGFTVPSTQTVTIAADGSTVVNYYYERNSYTLTLIAGDNISSVTGQGTYQYGKNVTIDATLASATGYNITFDGWYLNNVKNQTSKNVTVVMPAANTTLVATASKTVNAYTITYNLNGGSVAEANPVTYTVSTETFTLNNPTKVGYLFLGWSGTGISSLSKEVTIEKGSTGNRSYIANFTAGPVFYSVNYWLQNVDGGNEQNSSNYRLVDPYRNTATTGTNITPTVNTYGGFTSPEPQTVKVAADGSTTVNYYYTRNSYTITFDTDGGTAVDSITARYGATITAPANPTKDGYTFAGWDQTIPSTMPAENITIKATWDISNLTVTLVPNGGAVNPTSIECQKGKPYTNLPTPTREGYTFLGWYTVDYVMEVCRVTNDTVIITSMDHTLYAQWTANTNTEYKVQHWQQNIDADTAQNSTNYTLKDTDNLTGTTGASITPAVKTYTGFTAPSKQTTTILADGSRVVNYYYTRNTYTLTLNKNSYVSSVSGGGTYHYGKSVTINLTLGSATGYTYLFTNWTSSDTSLIPNQTVATATITMPAGNVTLTANGSRSANTYTVTLNKGTGISSVTGAGTYHYGDTVTINATVSSGYTWSKWTGTHSTTTKQYTFTMPASNVTDTANAVVSAVSLASKVKVGDYVDYPVSYSNVWTYESGYKPSLTGWRVVKVSGGQVYLVSAGVPLRYTPNTSDASSAASKLSSTSSFKSLSFAASGFSSSVSSVFTNDYTSSVRALTKADVDSASGSATTYTSDLFALPAGSGYAYYWLGTQYQDPYIGAAIGNALCMIAGRTTSGGCSLSFNTTETSSPGGGTHGVRPVVILKSTVNVTGGSGTSSSPWKISL